MKCKINYMMLVVCCLCLISACSEHDVVKDNPFDDNEKKLPIKIENTSNGDTLFLSWEFSDTNLIFDNFRIELDNPHTVKTIENNETHTFFTHIPYDKPISVTLSLFRDNKAINSFTTKVKIDGLDKVMAKTIIPNHGSVTGGDGMYSIFLPDERSLFLMGDSYIGTVSDGKRPTSDHMFRNTYILYDKGTVSAIYGANGDKNASAAVPPNFPNEKKWYWPGHGFVNDDRLYIFQTLMYQGDDGMWGFRYETTHILEYKLPNLELVKTTPIPFSGTEDIHYGMAVLKENDYIYIYAQVDISNDTNPISDVLVARTVKNDIYSNWEYYTGFGWSKDGSAAVKLNGLESVPVSSQFNVFKLEDKYVLLTQNKTFNSGEIYTFIADNPYGPWRNKKLIFKTYEQAVPHLLTYNAMAHPQFKKDGMILVSYNVNTEVFAEQFSNVENYRPRFFWVEIDDVLK